MSGWTHLYCDACWNETRPDRPVPVRVTDAPTQPCCRCGAETSSGIYMRAKPGSLACKNDGPVHKDEL